MELRDLHLFVVAAEELNFSRAATRLHITQPGLSQRIKILERDLGVLLFERSRQHVRLTDVGEGLLPEVRQLLAQAERVRVLVGYLSRRRSGVLALAYTRSAGVGLTSALTAEFRRSHPLVRLETSMGFTARNVEQVISGELDVAFTRACGRPYDELDCLTLGHDPVVVAVPAEHPLAGLPELRRADISGQPLVFFREEYAPGMWQLILRGVYGESREHRVARYEPEESLMLAAVADGAGIGLLTLPSAEVLDVPGIAIKMLRPAVLVPLELVWRRDNTNSSLLAFLMLARTFAATAQVTPPGA